MLGDGFVVRHERAGVPARAEVLAGVEAEGRGVARGAGAQPVARRAVRLAGVLEHGEPVRAAISRMRRMSASLPVQVDGDDEARALA